MRRSTWPSRSWLRTVGSQVKGPCLVAAGRFGVCTACGRVPTRGTQQALGPRVGSRGAPALAALRRTTNTGHPECSLADLVTGLHGPDCLSWRSCPDIIPKIWVDWVDGVIPEVGYHIR
jgi:hypothetical protein